MIQYERKVTGNGWLIATLVLMNAVILNAAITESREYFKTMLATLPLLVMMLGYHFSK